ncbi:MAG: hypothetical protein JXB24_04785 [Bacteroidales bacterium]|nr:hypothetical protein [Bacteroidales bacterium]
MNRSIITYIHNSVVILIVVSYFELFKLAAIPSPIRLLSQILATGIMILLIIISIIYLPRPEIKMNFSTPILILLIASIPSIFIATIYHHQVIIGSILGSRILLFYLLYFYLHFFKISVKFLVRVIVGIGLLAVGLYYLQFILYPKHILDIHIIEGRGTIRLFVAGMLCTQAAYFYFLNQFFTKKKLTYLILAFLSLSIFILQGTRQLIFPLAFLTLISILVTKQVKSKLLVFTIVSLSVVALFFIFQTIFIELTKVSSSQVANLSEGIRLRAAEFFLTTFMPNNLAYIFGNGDSTPGSVYYQNMILYAVKYGFFLSDIGIIGDYVKYGVVFIIAGIAMLVKSLTIKVSPKYQFFKFYILVQCFTLIAGSGILSGVDIILLIILYIFDRDLANQIKIKSAQEEYTELSVSP